MLIQRTITIKLKEEVSKLLPTFQAYTKAFNFTSKIGYDTKDFNGVSLHNKTYKEVRKYLPSQLAISSRMKATEAVKSSLKITKNKKQGKCPQSKLCSIRYDDRSLSVWLDKNEISLLTINGRIKYKIEIHKYYQKYLDWKRCSSDLVLRKNEIFLKIVMSKEIEDFKTNNKYYGIDRGVKRIAVVSNNTFYGGGKVKHISNRYSKLRSCLQSCGSRSAKRHLKKMSNKEQRFRKDVNHCISKRIVNGIESGSTLILENLKGIRKSANKWKKNEKREVNKWNFFQLETFLTYKARFKGIDIAYVKPHYTSQRCNKCGYIHKSNRSSQSQFKCQVCGYQLNADLNGSRNIKFKHLESIGFSNGVVFNRPNVSVIDAYNPHQVNL